MFDIECEKQRKNLLIKSNFIIGKLLFTDAFLHQDGTSFRLKMGI